MDPMGSSFDFKTQVNGTYKSACTMQTGVRSTFGIVIMELCSRSIEKNTEDLGAPLGGSSQVSSCGVSLPNCHENGAYFYGGDPNHLLIGMILQVFW